MLKTLGLIIGGVLALVVLCLLGLMFYLDVINPSGMLVSPDDELADVKIQPADALKLAEPHLDTHGTYQWHKERPLIVYIVRQKTLFSDWYFIKRHNYPAKTIRYQLHGAVKVHTQTGDIEYSKRSLPKSER